MHAPAPQLKKRLLRLRLNGRWREDAVAEGALLSTICATSRTSPV